MWKILSKQVRAAPRQHWSIAKGQLYEKVLYFECEEKAIGKLSIHDGNYENWISFIQKFNFPSYKQSITSNFMEEEYCWRST